MSIIQQSLISKEKYGIKCPYEMSPIGICVHNTYNDAPAENEIAYMKRNNNQVSFHIAVDDKVAIQAIPFNRNAWHAGDGNGQGNRKYISIEICYSKSGGERFLKAEKLASKVIAELLKKYNWGIDKIKKHQDFSGKYCPHRTLDMGWDRFLNMIKKEIGINSSNQESSKPPINKPTPKKLWEICISGQLIKDLQSELNKQFNAKLKVDGYFGDDTLNKCILVKKGAKGNITKIIQKRLQQLNYNIGKYGADGAFGQSTHDAVIRLQRNKGLSADGIVGKNTWKALMLK